MNHYSHYSLYYHVFSIFSQLLGAEDVEGGLSEEVVEEVAVEPVQVLGADLIRTIIFF